MQSYRRGSLAPKKPREAKAAVCVRDGIVDPEGGKRAMFMRLHQQMGLSPWDVRCDSHRLK
jgi:hypothetical protein